MFGISFLSPWWLAGFPVAAAGLIYIYRRRASQRSRLVSTLLLLKDFSKVSSERAKVEFPVRFFIELLLALMLVLLIARMDLSQEGRKIAYIIDTSLSTQALDAQGDSVFNHIVSAVLETADSAASSDSIDVYQTGSFGAVAQGVAADSIEGHLEALQNQGGQADNLVELTAFAVDKGYDQVHLFTDKELEGIPVSPRIIAHTSRERLRTKDNISIEKIFFNPQQGTVQLAIRSYSHAPASGTIRLSDGTTSYMSVDSLSAAEVTITPKAKDAKTLTASLKLDQGITDGNLKDNEMTVDVDMSASQQVVIVSALSTDALGLGLLKNYPAVVVSPESYEKTPQQTLGRMYIFHRAAPRALPKAPSLFILPGDAPVAVSKGLFQSGAVTHWDNAHPVTQYVHLELFTPDQMQVFHPQPWQQTIISSEEGALLLGSEQAGVRSVISGIELFPFRGKEAPVLSILTLNILKWLDTGRNDDAAGIGYPREEADLYANFLDISKLVAPKQSESITAQGGLRDLLAGAVLLFCIVDLLYLILKKQLIGGARAA